MFFLGMPEAFARIAAFVFAGLPTTRHLTLALDPLSALKRGVSETKAACMQRGKWRRADGSTRGGGAVAGGRCTCVTAIAAIAHARSCGHDSRALRVENADILLHHILPLHAVLAREGAEEDSIVLLTRRAAKCSAPHWQYETRSGARAPRP